MRTTTSLAKRFRVEPFTGLSGRPLPCTGPVRHDPRCARRAPGASGGRPFLDPTQPAIPASAQGASGETGLVRPNTPGVVIASGVILLALAVLALLWTALFFV